MTEAAKIYLSLGAVVLLVWWAYNNQAISPSVTESVGGINTGGTP